MKYTVVQYLRRYAELHGLLCPTGRGSTSEECVRLLPSDTTKMQLLQSFKSQCRALVAVAQSETQFRGEGSKNCILHNNFFDVWNQECSWIRIAKLGTDYCDTCTTLKNALQECDEDSVRLEVQATLKKHLEEAKRETEYLKTHREYSKSGSSTITISCSATMSASLCNRFKT